MVVNNLKLKRYLGDGVYAGYDGYQVWIWADRDGQRHAIALEPKTQVDLNRYFQDLVRNLGIDGAKALEREQL
jgi:hypothetical protein